MQTIKDGEIFEAMTGELSGLSEKLKSQLESGEIDGGTIANMPEKGKEVEINGLRFQVQQVTKSGNVVLELKGKKPA